MQCPLNNPFCTLLLILSCFLYGCDMNDERTEPAFFVYGENYLLNNVIINVESHANSKNYPGFSVWKTETLLYKGKQYSIPENNDDIVNYIIHYSYGQQVGMLKIDAIVPKNIRKGQNIHAFGVFRKGDGIFLKYYSRKSDMTISDPLVVSDVTLPQEEYFRKYAHSIYEGHELQLKKIFELHAPEFQYWQLYPYESLNFDYYKKLPLKEKQKMNMPEEYLRKMNLPEDELKVLLEDSKRR